MFFQMIVNGAYYNFRVVNPLSTSLELRKIAAIITSKDTISSKHNELL